MIAVGQRLWLVGALCLGLTGVAGCGSSGPTTHPVAGKVELENGNVSDLAGCNIEAASVAVPQLRASAEIKPDGSFALETLHAGVIKKGAIEGEYRLRIILSDDDPQSRKRAARAIASRYLQFETSGLQVEVPAKSAITLGLSAK